MIFVYLQIVLVSSNIDLKVAQRLITAAKTTFSVTLPLFDGHHCFLNISENIEATELQHILEFSS